MPHVLRPPVALAIKLVAAGGPLALQLVAAGGPPLTLKLVAAGGPLLAWR